SRKASRAYCVHKPRGQINHRVQQVGPEHFGIVSVDCAKLRSKFFLCDFYGKVLIPPTRLDHTQPELQGAITSVRQAVQQHQLRAITVSIEPPGSSPRPVQDAFRTAAWEPRLVPPSASPQFRQPADPANKTDDTDLAAIFRAAVNGFGLLDPVWPDDYRHLQLFARHRRDLVRKQAKLRCQIRAHLHSLMPGYADAFDDLFDYGVTLPIACRTGSAQAVRDLGLPGLRQLVADLGRRCRTETLSKILAWAQTAPAPTPPVEPRRQILAELEDDRRAKNPHILALD